MTETDSNLLNFRKSREVVKPGKIHPSIPTNDEEYELENEKMGYALILNHINVPNHEERAGADQDIEKLVESFKFFKFEIQIHTDLSVDETKEVLKQGTVDFKLILNLLVSNYLKK
jgi:hypothetical protein